MLDLAQVFSETDIYYELYKHRKIYTNEEALEVKAELDVAGTETKSLFLKDKKDNYYIFITFTTKRTDFKAIKQLIGKRLSIVSPEEMESVTGQSPGAVSPFGYEEKYPIIVDEELLPKEKWVFAPGRPDRSMVTLGKEFPQIAEVLGVETFILPQEI